MSDSPVNKELKGVWTCLQLGQVLEQHLADGALAEQRRQRQHALQRQLPQVRIGVREAWRQHSRLADVSLMSVDVGSGISGGLCEYTSDVGVTGQS